MFMPFQILRLWLLAIIAPAILIGGAYLVYRSFQEVDLEPEARVDARQNESVSGNQTVLRGRRPWGANYETAYFGVGVILLAYGLGGGSLLSPRPFRRVANNEPGPAPVENEQHLPQPDGSVLLVVMNGPATAEPIIFVHGWGLNRRAWFNTEWALGDRYRRITWDLAGLGQSSQPSDRDFSLERLANHLDSLIAAAGPKPVSLVGHSIGTMVILTYLQLHPAAMGTKVRNVVLAHGTYTNPVETTKRAALYKAIQKPILEPLCHLMVWTSPIVRALLWLAFLNGSAHRSTERDSFSGNETLGQLDLVTNAYCSANPAVVARGMLAMFRYDARSILPRVSIPTLVVAGERDTTCLPEASRYVAERIPGAQFRELQNMKHCGYLETYVEFVAMLAAFLHGEQGSDQSAAVGSK